MTQPTALFLADILEDAGKPADIAEKCAVELRRLHAELERCKQVCAATSESWRIDAEKWKISPKHPRQWYGLTDDEIALICGECAASAHKTDDISYARAIEAKLRERNA